MFDALLIAPGAESAKTLQRNGRVIHWIREAFGHLKTIGAAGEAVEVVQRALPLPQVAIAQEAAVDAVDSYGVVTIGKVRPESLKEILTITKSGKDFLEAFAYNLSCHRCWERELEGLVEQVAF